MTAATNRPRPASTVKTEVLNAEAAIYCELTERVHCLNASASIIWALCDGTRDVMNIVKEVSGIVGVSPADIEEQVEYALNEFRRLRLIQ